MKIKDIFEARQNSRRVIALVPGRFQPFHPGHYAVYKLMTERFGVDNTFISTSNLTNSKSPLNFDERSMVMTEIFKIPEQQIIRTQSPYFPHQFMEQYDNSRDILVVAVGQKDSQRLENNDFFQKFSPGTLEPFGRCGYYVLIEPQNNGISGSLIRRYWATSTDQEKQKFMKDLYGSVNSDVFDLFDRKFNQPIQIDK